MESSRDGGVRVEDGMEWEANVEKANGREFVD